MIPVRFSRVVHVSDTALSRRIRESASPRGQRTTADGNEVGSRAKLKPPSVCDCRTETPLRGRGGVAMGEDAAASQPAHSPEASSWHTQDHGNNP